MNEISASASPKKDTSVVKSLFLGTIIEENLFPFPALAPEENETLALVLESVSKFMHQHMEAFRQFDQQGEQPPEFVEGLKKLGLFGLIIGEESGGLGLSNYSYARVIQEISKFDGSTALTVGAHSSIGMRGLLLFGTEEQKKRYLGRLSTGELVAAFCLTESGAGSDAASIKTKAVKQPDGTWLLNGEKIWCTNGGIAGFFTVFARTDSESGKITAFIVERDWSGVSTGVKEDKMGIRASSTTTVSFTDVCVPADCVLGEEGHGFKVAMKILNSGRTGLGGGAIGAMKRCIGLAARHAQQRKQFGRSISEFELVKEKLTRMTLACFAAESVVAVVAHHIDAGYEDFSLEAAIGKVFCSEALWQTANDALQIAGGSGFMKDYAFELIVRDSRINLIFEGTNEILRLYIALYGLKEAGEYLKEIQRGSASIFNEPIKGFGVLSGYMTRRLSELTTLGRDRIEGLPPELRGDAEVLEVYTQRLGKATNSLLQRYKEGILGHQYLMQRLANVAIDLFVGLCMLSRVRRQIEETSVTEAGKECQLLHLFTQSAKRRMNQNLRRLIRNEDSIQTDIADHIVEAGGYTWDTNS